MRRWCVVLVAVLALLGARLAAAQDVPAAPQLRIETGTHTATVRDAATDAAGRVMVTAAEDKTARIWSLPDLRPLGVLRPPAGAADQGKMYAVAVSPDGTLAAVGGYTRAVDGQPETVYLFDLTTRQIVHALTGSTKAAVSIAFSSDGRIAAGMGTDGIRVWRDGALLFQDTDYAGTVYGVAFAPDGRLATSSWDGKLRLYGRDGGKLTEARTQAGSLPFRLMFSPDGARLAVGFADKVAVELRDGLTLKPAGRPDTKGLDGSDLALVRWGADGRTLFAAGNVRVGSDLRVLAWGGGGTGPRRVALMGFTNTIGGIVALQGGGVAGADQNGNLLAADAAGARLGTRLAAGANLAPPVNRSRPGSSLLLSRDGTLAAWVTYPAQSRRLGFDAAGPRLLTDPPEAGMADWAEAADGVRASDWINSTGPKLNGKALALEQYDKSRSVAAAPGRLLLGTRYTLRLFDAGGAQRWEVPVPGEAWRVNQGPDGRLAVAAFADSTIRWYRLSDGQELLALFTTEDAQRWVAWTKSGYYAAAPGAEDLIGWHVNRGPDQAADFFPASQFRDQFYRPDVVRTVLTTLDEAEALRQADAERGKATRPQAPITQDLPPVIAIVSPADGTRLDGPTATIRYTLRSPSGRPVKSVTVKLDGRPAEGQRGLAPSPPRPDGEVTGTVSVAIPVGQDVKVSLLAETDTRSGESVAVLLHGAAVPVTAAGLPKPNLYAVLVGASAYRDPALRLQYADKDARDLAAVLKQQEGRLFGDVAVKVLDKPDDGRDRIMDAIEWLRLAAKQNDLAILFLAGHGENYTNGVYYFLPATVDPMKITSTGVSQRDIEDNLKTMPNKVLLLLDTCHSGSVTKMASRDAKNLNGVINEFISAGVGLSVFSASTDAEFSFESDKLQNGAFTAALMEGLRGGADYRRDGVITLSALTLFVQQRVKELTGGHQHPVRPPSPGIPDFPLAMVR